MENVTGLTGTSLPGRQSQILTGGISRLEHPKPIKSQWLTWPTSLHLLGSLTTYLGEQK